MNKNVKSKTVFSFERAVETCIMKYGMIEKGDIVLVALSGGADSVSLLLALHALSEKLSFSLCACHLNHMIRKETAERDEDFSKALCQSLSIPFLSERRDIPSICEKTGNSTETEARNERYDFFEKAAGKFGACRIATAHTRSDNAETVIFNLVRGCSADGLCGIPPKRGSFIRPLIELSREDVEQFLSAKGQSFVTDETNSDTEYTRNFIRLSVIPLLKKLNPSLSDTLLRLSESSREDREYFEAHIDSTALSKLSCRGLAALPGAILSRHIRKLFSVAVSDKIQLSSANVTDIMTAVRQTATDEKTRRIDLPGKISAHISENRLELCTACVDGAKTYDSEKGFDIPLKYGENIINEKYAVFVAFKNESMPDVIKNQDIVYKLYKKADCVSDIIKKDAFARNRRENDSFSLGGMTRKLKKVFSEMKIEASERQKIPLVCDSEKIICLPVYSSPCDSEKAVGDDFSTTVAFYRS